MNQSIISCVLLFLFLNFLFPEKYLRHYCDQESFRESPQIRAIIACLSSGLVYLFTYNIVLAFIGRLSPVCLPDKCKKPEFGLPMLRNSG